MEAFASGSDVCDIAEAECQSAVLAMVAAARGKPIPPAPTYKFNSSAPDDGQRLLYPEDSETLRLRERWDKAYAALKLVPSAQSSRYAERHQRDAQLDKAFYSYQQRVVVMGARSSVLPSDPRAEMGTLAHELTHYMQDLELNFAHLYETTLDDADARASLRAMIEGEASYVGWDVQSRLSGLTPTASDWTLFLIGSTRAISRA